MILFRQNSTTRRREQDGGLARTHANDNSHNSVPLNQRDATLSPDAIFTAQFPKDTDDASTKHPSTIVTAYFEFPSKHSSKEYDAWMANMLSLQDAMVIYTTADMVPKIERLRAHAIDHTVVVATTLEDTRVAKRYDAAFWKAQHQMDIEIRTHKDVRLYWVWNSKNEFLKRTVDSNPFQSTFFAWVDIGYFRTNTYNGQHMLRTIPATLRTDQVLMLDVTSLDKSFLRKTGGRKSVGGGFIGGYANGIELWYTKYYAMLDAHKQEFIGKEQPWMVKTCDANPGLCQLVVPDRKHGNPWFYMAPYMMPNMTAKMWPQGPVKTLPG